MACVYAVLSRALSFVSGYAGMVSVCQAAFAGLGAYTGALLTIRLGCPWPFAVLISLVGAGLMGFLISVVTSPLKGDFFSVTSLGFQIVVLAVLTNWIGLTRGPLGLPDIPQPVILTWHIGSQFKFLILYVAIAIIVSVIFWRVERSPMGRALCAVRENEPLTSLMGKPVVNLKSIAFAMGAAMSAVAGCMFAAYASFIDPSSFSLSDSILILSMVVLGGAGTTWGPWAGALFLVLLPESLRMVGLSGPFAANARQILYGAVLLGFMLFRPKGIFGGYDFGRE